jgi:hypothetical protein
MPLQEHVDTLRTKHARLEQLIDDELHRPLPDQVTLSRLKKEKLRIKEQIQRTADDHEVSRPRVLN